MPSSAPRSGHPYHMHDAIYAQPGALRLLMRGQGEVLAKAATGLAAASHVWLTGVGTSWHAALAGELLLAQVGRLGAASVRSTRSSSSITGRPPRPAKAAW